MEKTINISPDLFKINSRQNRKHQKTRSNKNVKRLLTKIKEHAKLHSKEQKKQDILKPQTNDFNQHIEYLESIRQKRKKTRSNRPQEQVNLTVPNGLTQIKIKNPPKYGILKGGPTPTMREWKRLTQKNQPPIDSIDMESSTNIIPSTNSTPSTNLTPSTNSTPFTNSTPSTNTIPSTNSITSTNLTPSTNSISPTNSIPSIDSTPSANTTVPSKMTDVLKRKVENKFKLGPSKDKKSMSVFITNRRTRKKIQDDIQVLNTASLSQVKSYLKKYNLYKSGSDAPPDLLREIYKSAHLAGKPVINKSSENLIHNFYS